MRPRLLGRRGKGRAAEAIGALAPAYPVEVISPAEVRAARLTLRPLFESDRESYTRAVRESEARVGPYVPLRELGESDDVMFERQLRAAAEGDQNGSNWRRVGVLADGTIAGAFHLNAISRGLSWWADATWWIREGLTGRGLATEGITAMLEFALNDPPSGLGLHAVHAGVDPDNVASLRLVEKLGFVHDPEQCSHIRVGGEWKRHEFYVVRAA